MRFGIFIWVLLFANICAASSAEPYQRQVAFHRSHVAGKVDQDAKELLDSMYQAAAENCAINLGASYFAVVSDVAPSSVEDIAAASAQLAIVKRYIASLGFPKQMIFTDVIKQKKNIENVAPNIIVEITCRRWQK